MSIEAMAWAWRQELPLGPKAALLALANFADGDGVCYPGQVRLARMVGVSERSMRGYLATLEADGYIARTPRRRDDGSRTSDEYALRVQPAELAGSQKSPTGRTRQANRQNLPTLPAESAGHEPSVEPSVEPPAVEPTRAREQDLPEFVNPDTWQDFIDHRKAIKKPLTPQATKLLLRKLTADPTNANAMLEQSIANGWTGVFPIKNGDRRTNGAPAYVERPLSHWKSMTGAELLGLTP